MTQEIGKKPLSYRNDKVHKVIKGQSNNFTYLQNENQATVTNAMLYKLDHGKKTRLGHLKNVWF